MFQHKERRRIENKIYVLSQSDYQRNKVEVELNKTREECNRWNGLASSMVSLVLGYLQQHGENELMFDKCALCKQALDVLNLYGFKVGPKDVMARLIERRGEKWGLGTSQ